MPSAKDLALVLSTARALLADVDEAMARSFLDVIDGARDDPSDAGPGEFPLGPYPHLESLANNTTRSAVQAVADASLVIDWYQSDPDRVPPGWVSRSAATQLIGPDGGLASPDQSRLGLLYLSPHLDYPNHWHDPEEFYLVLAGSAEWTVGGTIKTNGPGDYSRTPSGAHHAIVTSEDPMLALWGWSGVDTSFDSYSY